MNRSDKTPFRELKIIEAQRLTKLYQESNNIFLTNDYIEATPEELEAKDWRCQYEPEMKGKSQVWYINQDGIAIAL